MAALKIHRDPVCLDRAGDIPKERWPLLIEARRKFCKYALSSDCRSLILFVEDGAKSDWLGLGDRETYLRKGLELDPELVAWAVEGLKRTNPEAAVTLDEAVVLGRHGGTRRKGWQGVMHTLRGTGNRAYTLARLRRDRPDLAERVADGELSANAAAIEAGFRQRTITIAVDPEAAARAICKHFTAEQGRELVRYLNREWGVAEGER